MSNVGRTYESATTTANLRVNDLKVDLESEMICESDASIDLKSLSWRADD